MIGKTLLRDVFLLLPSGKTERGAIAFDDTGILALGKNETVLSEHRTGARIISTSSSGRHKGNASSKDSCLNATLYLGLIGQSSVWMVMKCCLILKRQKHFRNSSKL